MASLAIEWDDCTDEDKHGVALWVDVPEKEIDAIIDQVTRKIGLPVELDGRKK